MSEAGQQQQKKKVVYLAGGDRAGWRAVVAGVQGFEFVKPSDFATGASYIDHRHSFDYDILFLYWEKDSLDGYTCALDMGAALANKLVVIYCDARQNTLADVLKDRCHLYYDGPNALQDGIAALNRIAGNEE